MTSAQTKKIHLIRHAESEHNVAWKLYGDVIWTDMKYKNPPLTPTGRQQVDALKLHQELYEVDEVFASPAQRTLETARLLYPDGDITAHDSLLEFSPGRIVNCRDPKVMLADEWSNLILDDVSPEVPTEEDEQDLDFQQRLINFIRSILITDYKSVSVVTHHDVIRKMWQIVLPDQPFPGIVNANYITITLPVSWLGATT
jgi:broad specificity phosphatase PhoE